jgi:peptide/nickel transport system permease protein
MIQFATDRVAFLAGARKWWIAPPGVCVALVVCSFAFVGLVLEERLIAASPGLPQGDLTATFGG